MDATRKRIERMEEEREERRNKMIQRKQSRKAECARLLAAGNTGDVDFIGMVEEWRADQARKQGMSHQKSATRNSNIIVAVRKRPMFEKEREKLDHDSVSCYDPKIWIHSAKFRVDGITKYLTHTGFQFDHSFGEESTTDQIYVATTLPLVDHVVRTQGRATVFCYGQTGSGKTHTMNGIQQILAHDLYEETKDQGEEIEIRLAFFELYSGYIQDLLHDRKRCKLLEDGKGEVNITGLQEVRAATANDFLRVIEEGHSQRTTRSTEANDSSSRSHAICQVFLRDSHRGKLKGKLTLVDLAGSERGSDTRSHDSKRRSESAEINTSLLSLKECIRALGQKGAHVPYRGSKLTLILKDCFSPDSKTTMIAMVSPGASSTDHSLNTLRYADRIKEQRISSSRKQASRGGSKSNIMSRNQPSPGRLSRITSVLCLDRNAVSFDSAENDVQLSQQQTHLDYLCSDAVEISNESEIEEDTEELSIGFDSETETRKSHGVNNKEASSIIEVTEMRKTAQALFEIEESLLDQHIKNIKENAEILRHEDDLLQTIEQRDDPTDDEMDAYAIQLAEFLDRKEELVLSLHSKLDEFKMYCLEEGTGSLKA
eukprot:CAMPEP_0197191310 /NCGR_PEP_ID=MMETSP1423-20130617/23147_1 /TAXON_ID=476441 /ORGANISM="Pseudo-nitzschia heimii, Strain UNC1101" /LENGTH=598 /DNA_ID=CAMNT_0042643909 /DNA_START=138 /DNA_END=1934 /DNA_ORIENTATION=+